MSNEADTTGAPTAPAEGVAGGQAGEHPAGKQAAVALALALVTMSASFALPFERGRTMYHEVQASRVAASAVLLVVFNLPLAFGALTLAARLRGVPPRGAGLYVAMGIVGLVLLGLCVVMQRVAVAMTKKPSFDGIGYDNVAVLLACLCLAIVLWVRSIRLGPWARWAHVVASFALAYVYLGGFLYSAMSGPSSFSVGASVYIAACGVVVPLALWLFWPPRWRRDRAPLA